MRAELTAALAALSITGCTAAPMAGDAGAPREGCGGGPHHGCPCDAPGARSCGSGVSWTCALGFWAEGVACPDAGLDASLDAPNACSTDLEIRCESTTRANICVRGSWELAEWLPSPGSCTPGSCRTTPEHIGCPCTVGTWACPWPWAASSAGVYCSTGRWSVAVDLCSTDPADAGVDGSADAE